MTEHPKRKDFFDQNAEQWDLISVHDLNKVDFITSLLKIEGKEHIMDIGTGTGVMIPFYEKALISGDVLAIDYSEKMIEIARKKYPSDSHPHIRFEVKDLYDIDYQNRFDIVMCYSCFPHFPDKPRAISILSRALKKNGTLMISHSCSRDKINQVHREGGDAISSDYLPSIEDLRIMLADAGIRASYTKDDDDYFMIIGQKVL